MTSQHTETASASAQLIGRLAEQENFALVGVAPAGASDYVQYIRQWLGAGKHGQMAYLAHRLDKRLDPSKWLPAARSVICVADRYLASTHEVVPGQAATGRIARYAWGDDYHKVIKKRLHTMADTMQQRWPGHQFRAAVDTAPLLEREHAQRAGLGWIGKHTLLIHQDLGSWLLLGQIVTTLPVEPDPQHKPVTDHCGTCTRCIDACPTDCISPYQLDASRCISYLTIEHRGPIEPSLQPMMGDWVAGCDVCQEVCPFNDRTSGLQQGQAGRAGNVVTGAVHPRYEPRPPAPALKLLEILDWDAETRQKAFTKSALKRIKLDQLKRNALIAAGNYLVNHEDKQLRRRVGELADKDESPLLRRTARQVLDRLNVSNP